MPKDETRTNKLLRYLLIVALNLLINYFGLKMLVEHFLWFPTIAKITITLLTVIISYLGQKHFSFNIKKQREKAK